MFLYSVKQCLICFSKVGQIPGQPLYPLRVDCRLNGSMYTQDLDMADTPG